MSFLLTPAIILKSQRWGEADRIVTFYTSRVGKIRGIARGARRMKSRFGGTLEPFLHVSLTVFEHGQDSLTRISHVDVQEHFWGLRENLERMAAGARLVNLVAGVSAERDPGPRMFDLLLQGLRTLEGEEDPTLIGIIFQILILGQTGFRPQTDHCAACGSLCQTGAIRFSPLAGGLLCPSCERTSMDQCLPMSLGGLAFIQQVRRLNFPAVIRLKAHGQVRKEVESAIEAYVRVVLEKPLSASTQWVAETTQSYGSS